MIRSLALMVSLGLAGATPALAQTHLQSHAQGRPHGQSGHTPLDPAQHAAMHALFHGSWTGTSTSIEGVPTKLDLAVATDKQGKVALKMNADQSGRVGAASNVAFEGNSLQWVQTVSGTACKATAVVSAATPLVPETMKGTMTCERGEITFALQKAKG